MVASSSSALLARADFPRMLADLRHLAQFGGVGRGVTRPAFSEPDMAARQWLAERFTQAGLVASVDGIGNVFGRDPAARQAIVLGSHSDSVPRGGWLDGAMGVIFALEAARAWREAHPESLVGIDVVAFADEEGTCDACVGSRAFCGLWNGPVGNAETLLTRALRGAGLSGLPEHRVDPLRHRAYLEAHIEQGPRLSDEHFSIGIVEGIVGVRRQLVRFSGRADHAGTTPMRSRRDAGRAMFAFCAALDAAFRKRAPADAVWNMGVASVSPGAANVVPRNAEVVVEYRHLQREVIDRLTAALTVMAETSDVPCTVEEVGALEPSAMDPTLMAELAGVTRAAGVRALRMASGAGHDAMILAQVLPSAMLFVPSIGGRSHDPAEDTLEADLATGLRIFVEWTFRILARIETDQAGPHGYRTDLSG